jgi:hypothetical protein
MDKLQPTGQNMGRVFNTRSGRVYTCTLMFLLNPNLKLKTRPKQLLGSFPLDITLPDVLYKYYVFVRIT